MTVDESALIEGQVRKPNALRKSVGDALGDEVLTHWRARQQEATTARRAAALGTAPVAHKIAEALAGYETCRTFRPDRDGYTVRGARGTGATGFVPKKSDTT